MTTTTETMTGTIKELSATLGLNDAETRGTLMFLAKNGLCKTVGKQVIQNHRGKPASIYQVNRAITLNLGA